MQILADLVLYSCNTVTLLFTLSVLQLVWLKEKGDFNGFYLRWTADFLYIHFNKENPVYNLLFGLTVIHKKT